MILVVNLCGCPLICLQPAGAVAPQRQLNKQIKQPLRRSNLLKHIYKLQLARNKEIKVAIKFYKIIPYLSIILSILMIFGCHKNNKTVNTKYSEASGIRQPTKRTIPNVELVEPYEVLKTISMDNPLARLPDKNEIKDYVNQYNKIPIKGDIIIFFVDTLNYEMAMQYAPTVRAFMQKYLSGKHIAQASGTAHSLFSVFHSQPSFLAYKDYLNIAYDESDYGAFYFQLLKKLDYDIFGIGQNFLCSREMKLSEYKYVYSENVNWFGYNNKLLNNCSGKEYLGTPHTFDFGLLATQHEDQIKIDRFESIYLKQQQAGRQGLYIIDLDNVHTAYSWEKKREDIPFPNAEYLNGVIDFGNAQTFTVNEMHQAYANAVYSMDGKFQAVLNLLAAQGTFDETTLIFLSDHGESLLTKTATALTKYDKKLPVHGHGNSLNKEEIEALYAIKFNNEVNIDYKNLNNVHLSGIDIFPTIFDGLRFELDDATAFYCGQSALQHGKRQQFISARPNGYDPTDRLCIQNDKYKIHLQLPKDNLYETNTCDIIAIHDISDAPIEKSSTELLNIIDNFETLFQQGLEQVFPISK